MRGIVRAGSLAAWLALVAGAAHAQEPAAAASQSYINGFLLVPWGSDTSRITALYGKPLIARVSEDGGLVLIYKDASLNKSILSLFYLDKSMGLVKGVSSVPYGAGSDCETVMRGLRDSILRIFSSLTPVEERTPTDPAVPFCAAAAEGKASWQIAWTDPASHNSVSIRLDPEGNRVEVTYQSGGTQTTPQPGG